MTLDDLARMGRLKPHTVDAAEIADLPTAARRNPTDASVEAISTEQRIDAWLRREHPELRP